MLVLVGVGVLGPAGAVRGQLARRGGEFQINTVMEGDQHAARIAALPGGGFIVAWDSGPDVAVRRFDADGRPIGPQFPVNVTTLGGAPSVAAAPGGSSLITWQSRNDIVGQRLDASGAPLGNEFTLTEASEQGADPSVAAVGNAQFVVVWEDPNSYLGRGRGVTADGQGASFAVSEEQGEQYIGGVASDGTGRYQVVWYNAFSPQMQGRLFQNDLPFSTTFTIDPVFSQYTGEPGPRICGHQKGGFVVVWTDHNEGYTQVEYRQLDSTGIAASPVVPLTPEIAEPVQGSPDVACGASYAYVIVWFNWGIGPPLNRGRLFSQAGFTDFAIGIVDRGYSEPLAPAILADGDVVVVWSDCAVGNACDVFGQRFTASGATDCSGDCNRDGRVTVDELVKAVTIALDPDPALMKQCLSADVNLDYLVTIDELVLAVNRALGGCS